MTSAFRLRAGSTALAAAALVLGACNGDGGRASLQVERDTIGDTLVVRTIAGSVWGTERSMDPEVRIGTVDGADEYMLGDVNGLAVGPDGAIYVYDSQIPALRKYDRNGEFVATFGREGGGPGEYKQSDGGLVALPDGRVVLRDPGNARLTVYSRTGEPLGHWPFRGGSFTSRPLYADTAGNVYAQIWGGRSRDERYTALLRFRPDGEAGDSLMAPDWEHETPYVRYAREGMSMAYSVPFSPSEVWTFSPLGYFVGGVSNRYAVDQFRPGGSVLRVERAVDPVAVDPGEKSEAEARITSIFRRYGSDWQWNGPGIPDVKPAFRELFTGQDGRIWVRVSAPAEPIPGVDPGPTPPGETPPPRWREPVVFDVFEPDGTYLGRVPMPEGFQTHPEPVFDGDRIWAVVNDELGVDYVVRFRLTPSGGPG